MKYIFALVTGFFLSHMVSAQNQAVSVFNSDSTIMGTGVLINNQMDGLWKFMDPKSDRLLQQGNFEKGEKEGTWVVYYPNNQKQLEAEYRNNRLNGAYREYDSEGALVSEKIYKDSVQIGSHKQYYGRAGNP